MNTYILKQNSSDLALLESYCAQFEKAFPGFKKLPPFSDRINGGYYVRFERGMQIALFGIETLWQQRIFVKANFDVSDFVLNLAKE